MRLERYSRAAFQSTAPALAAAVGPVPPNAAQEPVHAGRRGRAATGTIEGETMESGATERGVQTPPSHYRELAPSRPLAGAVVCTWMQVIGDGTVDLAQRVLPDGCADLLWIGDAPPVVVGPATSVALAMLPPRTAVLGVRLRPGWAASVLGAPASEVLDREVALRDLWGRPADALADPLLEEPRPAARFAAIEQTLAARCARARPADPLALAAVAWLARHPAEPAARLARELGVSPRHLYRRFAAAVGYGPKTFQRVARFQRLLVLGERSSARPGGAGLGQLALDAGYADQAHMTREVRALAGRTPTATVGVAGSALAMSDLFTAGPDERVERELHRP
jgi:AraC-like DNA-binding protein